MLDPTSVLFGMVYVVALWLVVEGARDLKRFANSLHSSVTSPKKVNEDEGN